MPDKDLGRQLAAVLASHCSLDAFDDRRDGTAIVLELFRTVMDSDLCTPANVLIVSAFIRILEPPPAANVVDEDRTEVGLACFHVLD